MSHGERSAKTKNKTKQNENKKPKENDLEGKRLTK